jgi:small subunit ribosomal protein S15
VRLHFRAGLALADAPCSARAPAALLTYQIRKLHEHLRRTPRDIANRRSLRMLCHQRAKILRYLKRTDRERYSNLLPRIGVEPGAVEGEIVV